MPSSVLIYVGRKSETKCWRAGDNLPVEHSRKGEVLEFDTKGQEKFGKFRKKIRWAQEEDRKA